MKTVLTFFFIMAALHGLQGETLAPGQAIHEDFEGDFNGENIAEGWSDNSSWAPVDVHYERDTVNPHGGKSAQKIVCTRFGGGAVQFIRQSTVGIEKGKIYRLSFWVRGMTASGKIALDIRKTDSPWTSYLTQEFGIGNEWRRCEIFQQSNVTDPECWIMVRFSSVGEVVVDDMEFEGVDPAKLAAAGRSVGNLVWDGTFEMGGQGWGGRVEGTDYIHGNEVERQLNYAFTSEAAYDGKVGLRVIIPQYGWGNFFSHPMPLVPLREYSVSCWARADREGAPMGLGLAGGESPQEQTAMQTVSLGTNWRRIQATVQAPLISNGVGVRMSFDQVGQYDVDNVQVEEGDRVTRFAPRGGADYGLLGLPPTGYVLQNVKCPARLARYAPQVEDLGEAGGLTVRVFDFSEKTIFENKMFFSKGSAEIPCDLPTARAGVFRVEVANEGGDLLAQHIYAVLPAQLDEFKPGPVEASFFGTHVCRCDDEALDFARLTGSRWLRLHPPLITKWMVVENHKGDFVWYDDFIKHLRKKGFKILGSLDTTAVWASQRPELGLGWTGEKAPSYPAKDIADWENYVRQMVGHYQGMIDDWEVWNEPDSGFFKVRHEEEKAAEYVRLLAAAFRTAHAVNPRVRVLGGVGCGIPTSNWSKKVADAGGLAVMDVLSFHWYSSLPAIDNSFFDDVAKMRGLGGPQKPALPLWNSESGIFAPVTFYREPVEEKKTSQEIESQTAWVTLHYVGNRAAGVEKMFFYVSNASGELTRQECTPLQEWDGAWRPPAVAALVTARLLDGTKVAEAPSATGNVQQAVFTREGCRIICAWKNYNLLSTGKTTLIVPAGDRLVDVMGNVTASKEERTVDLGFLPVWIIHKESPSNPANPIKKNP